MPLIFSFALSQQQTFTLRSPLGSRLLDRDELEALIDLCQQQYYPKRDDLLADLVSLGRRLFAWLDGKEGWLRRAIEEPNEQSLYLDLIQTSEAAQLNPATEWVALGLAHLPWELLHDGSGFLVERGVLPVRLVQQRHTSPAELPNRPLRLLLMATSPETITPVLSYEQEEANILQATETQPLALVVEESGSVTELGDLVKSYPDHHFDVFHLTGHGLIFTQANYGYLVPNGHSLPDHTPCFITEDAVGAVQLTTVADLARTFQGRWCPVMFLSGCHTGEVPGGGTVPSMAQALVKAGGGTVLGWARPVYDETGIVAARVLYRELATGATVEEAVRATQQEMVRQYRADPRKQCCSDWHLLRLYCSGQANGARTAQPLVPTSSAALVTPLRTPRRERLRIAPAEQDFLDANRTVKVASREAFVGRRRPLQRCLRALRETSDQTGVWIAGMGGLGKSTLAARLCTRVQAQRPQMQMVVLVGVVDEVGLLNQLSPKYERFAEVPALLNNLQISLKGRLQNFFETIETTHDQPLLLVLDDFEQNIPAHSVADGSMRLSAEAYRVLDALCAALEDNNASSRLLVTCRYLEPATLPLHRLHLERLTAMNSADISKKRRLLPSSTQTILTQNPPLLNRILDIADGNPRLLEWLTVLLPEPGLDTDTLFNRLEQTETKFREDILAETLIRALEPTAQTALAQLSVFHLPVPAALVTDLPSLTRAIALGLVEQTPDPITYRVPTILEPLVQPILSASEWQQTLHHAAQQTYELWWETDGTYTEERGLEIVRLALLTKVQDMAVGVGSRIINRWVNANRYGEAIDLCEKILAQFEDVGLLLDLARAEKVVGRVTVAAAHYEQASTLCTDKDTAKRSAIWFNQAELLLQQGEVERAIALYEQSLQLYEQINDVQGKAASLHQLAGIYAQQGEVERAIALYQQSLQLKEQINDVQGKAITLNNLAFLAFEKGDVEQALEFLKPSAQALGQARAYVDLFTVLSNIGATTKENPQVYLAQALWLALRIQVPLPSLINRIRGLYNQVPQGDNLAALLAAAALWFCGQRQEHPQQAQLHEISIQLAAGAAAAQGVDLDTPENFWVWWQQQPLHDPQVFLPKLQARLEAMVGDGWLFERG